VQRLPDPFKMLAGLSRIDLEHTKGFHTDIFISKLGERSLNVRARNLEGSVLNE
jgi:hypothetical protein